MSEKVILAPHLDDEIIGCYSILDQVKHVLYFHGDYRSDLIEMRSDCKYVDCSDDWYRALRYVDDDSEVYVPSRFDHHPLHRKVNRFRHNLPGKKWYYSVDMNVPWLEEEESPESKRRMCAVMYPKEMETLGKDDKWFLFKSIKPYDDYIWASVRFRQEFFHRWPDAPESVGYLRNLHRHMLHIQVDVQQFHDGRDLEYHTLLSRVKDEFGFYRGDDSCETVAFGLKREMEHRYPDRAVRVQVYEDGENGCVIE